jgi:hypothetical protein
MERDRKFLLFADILKRVLEINKKIKSNCDAMLHTTKALPISLGNAMPYEEKEDCYYQSTMCTTELSRLSS